MTRRARIAACLWLALAAPLAAQAPAVQEVVTAADAAVAEAGSPDDAVRALLAISEAVPEDAPPAAQAYPFLCLARLYDTQRNWRMAEAMASGTVNTLETEATRAHPYRIEALFLQGRALVSLGRPEDALLTLRPATALAEASGPGALLPGLRYFLAVAATRAGTADAGALRAAYREVHGDQSAFTDGDLLVLEIEGLSLDALAPDADPQALADRSRQLMAEAGARRLLSPGGMATFRDLHARILLQAGAYAEAIPLLRARLAEMEEAGRYDAAHVSAVIALARTLARSGDLPAGAAALARAEDRAGRAGTVPDESMALLIATRGGFANALGDAATAQDHYRRAYATARRTLRRSDDLTARIAAEIDPADPGMAGFAFAGEFRHDSADLTLTPDGADLLRLVMAGRYGAARDALQEIEARSGDTALLAASRAFHFALTGETGKTRAALDAARSLAARPGADLPPDAPLLDLAELVAVVFGSTLPLSEAAPALDRLRARDDLPPDLALLVGACRISGLADAETRPEPALAGDLRDWMAAREALPESPFADFATLILAPDFYRLIGADPAQALLEEVAARHDGPEGLGLIRDQLRLDQLINATGTAGIEDRIATAASLAASVANALPETHALNIWNMNAISDQLGLIGRHVAARDRARLALALLRDSPGAAADVEAYLLQRLSMHEANLGNQTGATALSRQAYDLIDPVTARPWAVYPVILGYAIELQANETDWRRGAAVVQRYLDDPAFVARMPPEDILYMRFAHARMVALAAPPEEALAALAAVRDALPDDGRDRRDTRAILGQMEASALHEAGRLAEAWDRITGAADLDRAWRNDTYGALAQASGLATAAVLRSTEAEIGWAYARSLD